MARSVNGHESELFINLRHEGTEHVLNEVEGSPRYERLEHFNL